MSLGGIFLRLLNLSITAGWLILAVMALRLPLKKAPRWISCLLWALVAVRLICPFSLESAFSLIPSRETIPRETILSREPDERIVIDSGVPIVDELVNPVIRQTLAPKRDGDEVLPRTNPLQTALFAASAVWGVGACGLLVYAVASFLRLRLRVRTAVRLRDNIYISEFVDTPFILGTLRPRIYLPSAMEEKTREPVLAHELAHLSRGDHLWKSLGWLLLSVYWFHPLCWAAYSLFCRDIELACDERVIRNYDSVQKKQYSEALLCCSVNRPLPAACPLAFGEVGVRQRIRSVLHYKKPTVWLIAAAVIACGAAALCFLTDPVEAREPADGEGLSKDGEGQPADGQSQTADGQPEESDALRNILSDWITAFVNRDGAAIAALTDDGAKEDLRSGGLLSETGKDLRFADSDGWPLSVTADVSMRQFTDTQAVVYYYAWDEEPHITVWKETLALEKRDGGYIVCGEEMVRFENIASREDFMEAYGGIDTDLAVLDGSRMDYEANGAGESLNRRALLNSGLRYRGLLEPETAAVWLLNLSQDPGEVTVERVFDEGKTVGLQINFLGQDRFFRVCMEQVYGDRGIWIPRDYRVDPLYRLMQTDWDEIRSRNLVVDERYIEWNDIVCIGKIPEKNITLYGYNDEDCFGRAVALMTGDSVAYFDWYYISPRAVYPDLFWNEKDRQLQVSLHIYTGTGADAQEFHVLQLKDGGTWEDNAFELDDYSTILCDNIGLTYDAETMTATLTDTRSKKEIAAVKVDGEDMGAVNGLELGGISHFALGERIILTVEPGCTFEEGGVMPQYGYLPEIWAEIVLKTGENGIELELGEIGAVQ